MSDRKIAYVLGEFPLVSLTFIQREIEALRALDLTILTCAMRQTPSEQHPGPAEKEAARTTFYVIEALKNPLQALAAQGRLFTHPRAYFSGLKLAFATRAPGLKSLFYQLVYFAEATVLARHLEAQDVTHMHAHFTTGSATVSMLTSELTGIPYSFTLHGPADFLEPYRWRLDTKAARAAFVAIISHYARSQLMFFCDPVHWPKIRIIHCGVMPERYDAPRTKTKTGDQDEIRLIFVGRIAPVKGLRILAEALMRLQENIPNLTLTLVGDGPDRAVIETALGPLGDRIRFTGYLDQAAVAAELNAADIAVLPSFAEGVPVFLMEALASGLPVICTQVAGMSELVTSGENGLIVPPGDVDSLTQAIRTLCTDTALREKMAKNAPAHVLSDFDTRTEAARLATLFVDPDAPGIRPAPREIR